MSSTRKQYFTLNYFTNSIVELLGMARFYEPPMHYHSLKRIRMNEDLDRDSARMNVMEERATIDTETVENSRVRVSKKVHNEEANVDLSTRSETVSVKRIPIDKYVEAAPEVRYEGDTMIVPVIHEVAVIEKRLLLVEEVHILKSKNVNQETETVPLRREEVIVERVTTE